MKSFNLSVFHALIRCVKHDIWKWPSIYICSYGFSVWRSLIRWATKIYWMNPLKLLLVYNLSFNLHLLICMTCFQTLAVVFIGQTNSFTTKDNFIVKCHCWKPDDYIHGQQAKHNFDSNPMQRAVHYSNYVIGTSTTSAYWCLKVNDWSGWVVVLNFCNKIRYSVVTRHITSSIKMCEAFQLILRSIDNFHKTFSQFNTSNICC